MTSAGSSSACAPASGEAAFIALLQAHRLSPRSSNLRLCWRIAGARTRLAVDAQHTLPKLDTSLPDSTTAKAALTTVVFARAPLQDWTEAAASCVADHFLLNETSSERAPRRAPRRPTRDPPPAKTQPCLGGKARATKRPTSNINGKGSCQPSLTLVRVRVPLRVPRRGGVCAVLPSADRTLGAHRLLAGARAHAVRHVPEARVLVAQLPGASNMTAQTPQKAASNKKSSLCAA